MKSFISALLLTVLLALPLHAAQHDFDITTADANTGTTFRAAVNAALQALATLSSGATEPASPYAYQLWADTASGKLKIRNAANNGWVNLHDTATSINTTNNEINYVSGVTSPIQGQIDAKAPAASPSFSGSPSMPNLKITGTSSADVNTLDYYQEGTFVPTIKFGGSATGLIMSSVSGKYTRIGNIVYYAIRSDLLSKGSSSGSMSIEGLPFTSAGSPSGAFIGNVKATNMAAGKLAIRCEVFNNNNKIYIYVTGTGTSESIATDADVTDSANISLAGFYFVP